MHDRSISLKEYLDRTPDDEDWAREVTERYRELTPAERLRELSRLNGWIDVILAGKQPLSADGERPFFELWKDPRGGVPR